MQAKLYPVGSRREGPGKLGGLAQSIKMNIDCRRVYLLTPKAAYTCKSDPMPGYADPVGCMAKNLFGGGRVFLFTTQLPYRTYRKQSIFHWCQELSVTIFRAINQPSPPQLGRRQ